MAYSELLAQDRRLAILLLLAASPAGAGNEALLHAALPDFGHSPSADQIRSDLAWLAEQGLITSRETHGLMVATLTGRGQDVAEGRAVVPGVKKPRLGGPGPG
jgi:Fe2+ or Zn2+ uptake regulation protein